MIKTHLWFLLADPRTPDLVHHLFCGSRDCWRHLLSAILIIKVLTAKIWCFYCLLPIAPNITSVIVIVSLCPQLRLGRVQEAEEERQLRMHGEGGSDLWSWHGSCNQHLLHSRLEDDRNTTVQILTRPLTAARFHNSTSTTKHCLNNPSDISPFISINLFNYDFFVI